MVAKKPVESETQSVIVRMPRELHRQLRFLSVHRRQSMNALVVEALSAWWARQPENGKFPEAPVRKGRK